MGRRDYPYFVQNDFRGGINQEPENARRNQVLDARNVWCPNGRLEQRPGYQAVYQLKRSGEFILGGGTTTAIYETGVIDGDGTGTLVDSDTITGMAVGDRFYIGFQASGELPGLPPMFIKYLVESSNEVPFRLEYWNGTEWGTLANYLIYGRGGDDAYYGPALFGKNLTVNASGDEGQYLFFSWPNDIALISSGPIYDTEASGTSFYWVRMVFEDDDAGVPSNGTQPAAFFHEQLDGLSRTVIGADMIRFPQSKRYLFFYHLVEGSPNAQEKIVIESTGDFNSGDCVQYTFDIIDGLSPAAEWRGILDPTAERPTIAVVPEFNEAYVAYSDRLFVIPAFPENVGSDTVQANYAVTTDTDEVIPTVEDDPVLVGTVNGIKGDYHPDFVPQLADFPNGKYVKYFNNQLWVAGFYGDPNRIRWSAPAPAYAVWPKISTELLIEDDNSPITGLSVFNEQLVIFKENSIWRMVFNGEVPELTGVGSYVPVKDVSGVGCVAQSSIVQIPEGLLFLAEDGMYVYNGTPNVVKVSDALDPLFDSVARINRSEVSAIHWRSKNCALIALPVEGSSTNNRVLVYDYKHRVEDETGRRVGSMWIWDTLPANTFFSDQVTETQEVIYFADGDGAIHRLDDGKHDYGSAVTAYVQTHRIGYHDGEDLDHGARDLRLDGTNDVASLTATVFREDEDEYENSGFAVNMGDVNEATLDDFTIATDKMRRRKRREASVSVRKAGNWFTVKVLNSVKNQLLKLQKIRLGYITKGRR